MRKQRAKETQPRQQPEAELRKEVIKHLRKKGFKVWRVETAIVGQIGLPDLWVSHRLLAKAGWIELKAQNGVLSTEQLEFIDLCGRGGVFCFVVRSIEDCNRIFHLT